MNTRRRLTGTVVRANSLKTVVVEIKRSFRHPIYEKVIRTSNKMMVHDELECKIGDEVRIIETKPISRKKRWAVEAVLSSMSESDAPPADETEDIGAVEVEE